MTRSHFFPLIPLFIILTLLVCCIPASSGTSQNQTNGTTSGSGTDYAITKVTMPVQTSWVEPGTYIHPNITLRNGGTDDISAQPIEIQAFLGKFQLISKNSQISPLKQGEERTITPDYLVPNGVPTGEYTLTIFVNPGDDKAVTLAGNNQASAHEPVNVKQITSKAKVSSCGCSQKN